MLLNQAVDDYSRETQEYMVAYIDLLGVTNRIKDKETDNLSMNILHNLYSRTIEDMQIIDIQELHEIKYKIFSDNIIIAIKLSKDDGKRKKQISAILFSVRDMQETAASDCVGWMLRGGISIGQLYIDDVLVWGDALVKAYKLEDTVANYPRVVIANDIIEELLEIERIRDYIRRDFDGLYFVNYLADCHFVGEPLMNGFEKMKREVNWTYNERLLQKFVWHMNFINSELDKKKEKKDKCFRLSL